MKDPPIPKLHRWTLDLDSETTSEEQVDDLGVDFPVTSPKLIGQ